MNLIVCFGFSHHSAWSLHELKANVDDLELGHENINSFRCPREFYKLFLVLLLPILSCLLFSTKWQHGLDDFHRKARGKPAVIYEEEHAQRKGRLLSANLPTPLISTRARERLKGGYFETGVREVLENDLFSIHNIGRDNGCKSNSTLFSGTPGHGQTPCQSYRIVRPFSERYRPICSHYYVTADWLLTEKLASIQDPFAKACKAWKACKPHALGVCWWKPLSHRPPVSTTLAGSFQSFCCCRKR